MVRRTTITEFEEYQIVLLRVVLLLSLDDLVRVVQAKINPKLTRASIERCLKRCAVDNLDWLIEKIGRLQDKTEQGQSLLDKNQEPLTYKALTSGYRDMPFLVCYEITFHKNNGVFFFFVHPALKMIMHVDTCKRQNLDARRELHRQRMYNFSYVVLQEGKKRAYDVFDLILKHAPDKASIVVGKSYKKELEAYFEDIKSKIGMKLAYTDWNGFFIEVFDYVDELRLPYSKFDSRKKEAKSFFGMFHPLFKSGKDRFSEAEYPHII